MTQVEIMWTQDATSMLSGFKWEHLFEDNGKTINRFYDVVPSFGSQTSFSAREVAELICCFYEAEFKWLSEDKKTISDGLSLHGELRKVNLYNIIEENWELFYQKTFLPEQVFNILFRLKRGHWPAQGRQEVEPVGGYSTPSTTTITEKHIHAAAIAAEANDRAVRARDRRQRKPDRLLPTHHDDAHGTLILTAAATIIRK